jgi:hypothetical protein
MRHEKSLTELDEVETPGVRRHRWDTTRIALESELLPSGLNPIWGGPADFVKTIGKAFHIVNDGSPRTAPRP